MTILELTDAHVSYGPYRALNGCTFSVREGEHVALLGRNGAGKSTVARVATGLVPVASGSVEVLGRSVRRRAPHELERGGVVHLPEGAGLFRGLSIEENLWLRTGARRGKEGRRRMDAALSMLPEALRHRRRTRAGSLSGGQQRLVAVAAAVASAPKLLIADEPALGLAPAATADVYRALALAATLETTMVVIETRLDRVTELCPRSVVLDRGVVAADTATTDRDAIRQALLGTGVTP